ncbi:MAG: hypothetical protein WC308_03755 [archaeon]
MISIEGVEFSKLPEIDEVDAAILKDHIERFLSKVSFGERAKLHFTFKEHRHSGLKIKHEIHARLEVGGKSFFASGCEWQLIKTVQSTLEKLKKEAFKGFGRKI